MTFPLQEISISLLRAQAGLPHPNFLFLGEKPTFNESLELLGVVKESDGFVIWSRPEEEGGSLAGSLWAWLDGWLRELDPMDESEDALFRGKLAVWAEILERAGFDPIGASGATEPEETLRRERLRTLTIPPEPDLREFLRWVSVTLLEHGTPVLQMVADFERCASTDVHEWLEIFDALKEEGAPLMVALWTEEENRAVVSDLLGERSDAFEAVLLTWDEIVR